MEASTCDPTREPEKQNKISPNALKKTDNISTISKEIISFSKLNESVVISTAAKSEGDVLWQDILIAATLVDDAKDGKESEFKMDEKSVKLYLIHHHWGLRYLLFLFIFLNHFITLFEKPAVDGIELPYWVTMCMELACLIFYGLRLFHSASFTAKHRFWSDKKNIAIIGTICLTVIDIICYLGLVHSSKAHLAYRWSRPLRPVFFINFSENKQVRRAFRSIRRTLPDILNVLILFFLSVVLFSLMGQKLFMRRGLKFPDGSSYFSDYFDIFFDLYILVTTSNSPDIMMPAYDQNHWYAFFFVIYTIICLYIFMNIFLAVVYNNYRKHLKNEIRIAVYLKRQNLAKAFDLLRVKIENKYFLSFRRFTALMKMIPPARSPTMINILWFVLDRSGDNRINKADFLQLADLLNVGMSEIQDRKTAIENWFPKFYNSLPSTYLRIIVSKKYFRYFFDLLIVVNAALIAFDVFEAEWAFLSLFTVEIACKIYTFGWKIFFQKFWNAFDFIIIGAAILGTTIESILGNSALVKTRTLDVLLVLRVLRLVKIIGSIKRFQVIVTTIMSLGPSILTYGGVLFVVYYTFAIIGMELFHGLIRYHGYGNITNSSLLFCGNPKLNGSLFYSSQYCSNNFNNIINSFVLLFELMVVNQWHILASGFVLVTSKAARIYFFLFHLTCVIIVLNIFTAFVLEAFIMEYSFSKSKMESTLEKKIEEMGLKLERKPTTSNGLDKDNLVKGIELYDETDQEFNVQSDIRDRRKSSLPDMSQETDIRFHLRKKKDVESLLQRMFENELEIEDIGPDNINDLEDQTF